MPLHCYYSFGTHFFHYRISYTVSLAEFLPRKQIRESSKFLKLINEKLLWGTFFWNAIKSELQFCGQFEALNEASSPYYQRMRDYLVQTAEDVAIGFETILLGQSDSTIELEKFIRFTLRHPNFSHKFTACGS